jgi:uncharacterized protein (DUF433 family)
MPSMGRLPPPSMRAIEDCVASIRRASSVWGRPACVPKGRRRGGHVFRVLLWAGQTRAVTSEQLELISADPQVMHGQAVIAGTRVPVSVILDCLAAGMTAEQITAEYPTVTAAGVRAAAAYGAALAREELLPIPPSR